MKNSGRGRKPPIDKKGANEMRKFKVLIEDSACYVVEDENDELTEADALRIAEEWFIEREPTIYIEELEPSSFGAV